MFTARDITDKDLSWINLDNYKLVRDKDSLHEMIARLEAADTPAVDCETEGLSHLAHNIVGMSFSPEPGHAYYVPICHRHFDNIDFYKFKPDIQALLQKLKWKLFNAPFDLRFIRKTFGIELDVKKDVQCDAWLIDSDRGPSTNRKKLRLDYLSKELLNIDQLKLEDLLDKNVFDFSLVTDEIDALMYAGGDSDCTNRVSQVLDRKIEYWKLQDMSKLEAVTTLPVAEMEYNGIHLDKDHAKSVDLTPELERLQSKIADLTESAINPGSPDQVAALLYDKLKLNPPKKDSRSVDERALTKLKNAHPVIPEIMAWRELSKLKTGFLDVLKDVVCEDGRVHGGLCQSGTRSGRFSAWGGFGKGGQKIDFNGQTMPNNGRINCRKSFAASPDHYWVSSDFGQIEYRVIAYVSQDKGLMEAYEQGIDFHTKTAALMLKKPVSEINEPLRKKGKTLNFAISFGMTDMGLALSLGISKRDAQDLKAQYFKNIPGVDKLIKSTKSFIAKNGYVRTELGRIRHYDFSGCDADHVERLLMSGFNTRIQGTAADLNKIALVRTYKALKKEFNKRVRFLSTIHDELNKEWHRSVPVGVACQATLESMAIKAGLKKGWLDFPVEIEVGANFGELFKVHQSEFSNLKTLEDLHDLIRDSKRDPDAPDSEPEHPPESSVVAKLRTIKLAPPCVLIDIKNATTDAKLTRLREIIDTNYGVYQVYIKDGDNAFICHQYKVNPSQKFLDQLAVLQIQVDVRRPSLKRAFDPASLIF